MSNTTTTHAPSQERSNPKRDRRNHNNHGPLRSAKEIHKHLPLGWTAKVVELDEEATKDERVRARLMVLENPDKGWKLLPFMTIRIAQKTRTTDENGVQHVVETTDDMDILPSNVLEVALPANVFGHGNVLEELTIHAMDFAMKQKELPPPHKRPVTQRISFKQLQGASRSIAAAAKEAPARGQEREDDDSLASPPRRRHREKKRDDRRPRGNLRLLLAAIL